MFFFIFYALRCKETKLLLLLLLLDRVAFVRGLATYSHQTFPWTICRSVRRCVGLSSALWKNGGSDPDAVWHHRSDGSRHEANSGVWESVHQKGYFWGQIWGACNQWGLYGVHVNFRSDAALFPNYFGQICYYASYYYVTASQGGLSSYIG